MPTRAESPNILVTILVVFVVALVAAFLIVHLHNDAASPRAAGVGSDVGYRSSASR